MSDKIMRGGVPVKLYTEDGEEDHTLFLDLGAQCRLQKDLGAPIQEIIAEFEQKAATGDREFLRTLLYHTLLHEGEIKQLEDVDRYVISEEDLFGLMSRLSIAITNTQYSEADLTEIDRLAEKYHKKLRDAAKETLKKAAEEAAAPDPITPKAGKKSGEQYATSQFTTSDSAPKSGVPTPQKNSGSRPRARGKKSGKKTTVQ